MPIADQGLQGTVAAGGDGLVAVGDLLLPIGSQLLRAGIGAVALGAETGAADIDNVRRAKAFFQLFESVGSAGVSSLG